MVEITDEDSAQAWFETQPQEVCVAIAARAALRAAPGLARNTPETFDQLAFLTFRLIIISSVAANGPTAEIKSAARSAFSAADSATRSAAARYARSAAFSAAFSARSAADSAAFSARSAFFARSAADSAADSAAYSAVSFDAITILSIQGAKASYLFETKIWPEEDEPEGLQLARTELIKFFDANPDIWSFWKRWYLAMFNGTWRDWDLARDVALIPNDVWEDGAAAVAAEIRTIEAKHLVDGLPQADEIRFDPDQDAFTVQTTVEPAQGILARVLKQVSFACDLAIRSNASGFNTMCTAYQYIEFTRTACADDANAVDQNFDTAREDLLQGLDLGDYQVDSHLTALIRTLDSAIAELRANHPDVRDAREKVAALKLRTVTQETRVEAAEQTRRIQGIFADRLAQEIPLDATTFASGASPEVQAKAGSRLANRLARIYILLDESGDLIKRVEASAGIKFVVIAQALHWLINFFSGIF